MSRNVVLAVLTALTLGLTAACGSTVAGVSSGAGGTGSVGTAEAPSLPSDDSTPTDGPPADDTSTDSTPTDTEPTDETPTDDTSVPETGGDESTAPGTGGGDAASCEAFSTLATGFGELLQKVAGGQQISQQEVDAVFTDDVRSALPASLSDTFDQLKALANKLVGKSITELTDLTDELTNASTLLQDGIQKACNVG